MLKRNSKTVKIIALLLAITFIGEVVFPNVALAITSGNSQPEIYGYQAVDATDNVSLTTGAFNYTIPITSIPEYPMAMSYRSGVRPDQEASCFGYGFNSFSGAIGRNVLGIPDDANGVQRIYDFDNQTHWSASAGVSLGVGTGVLDLPIGTGASVSITGGYDNYNGVFGSVGLGIGIGTGYSGDNSGLGISGGLGIGLVSDSREQGLRYGAGANIGISAEVAKDMHMSESLMGASYSNVIGDKSKEVKGAFIVSQSGISNFSGMNSSSLKNLAPLANVYPKNVGWGASLTVPIPVGGALSLSITGTFNRFKSGNETKNMNAFGFNYLNYYDRTDIENIADFTIEGESSFPEEDDDVNGENPRNNPSYLQRDYFMVNAMGISGTMQLHQKEYGVVSRNYSRYQYRDVGLLTVKTKRQEVLPWTSVNQAKLNKNIDIVKFIKNENPGDRDFDNVLFEEKELLDMTQDDYSFAADPVFKMRGDLAGAFNLGSSDCFETEANDYDLIHITGTGNSSWGFLKQEKEMELYYPTPTNETWGKYNNAGEIERSTQISYKKITDMLNIIPNNAANEFDFGQSFYVHYENNYSNPNQSISNKKVCTKLQDDNCNDVDKFNLLSHLNSVPGLDEDMIGWIEMLNPNGLKYIFNLPVFIKNSESLQLSGKREIPPSNGGSDYHSFNSVDRNKVNIRDEYAYPYAWLLTAVVGEDYIDFDNIPGPSDGDIGFWVKFRYIKTADDYRFRNPYTGLNHLPGALHTVEDDTWAMTTGTKEVYQLSEIESSDYVCKYTYQKRYDGWDAAGKVNGDAFNSMTSNPNDITVNNIGENPLYAVSQIDLYKKHYSGNNSEDRSTDVVYDPADPTATTVIESPEGKIIKSTKFWYDYSLSKGDKPNHINGIDNNLQNYTTILKSTLPYYIDGFPASSTDSEIETGRLTLRKVQHIAYDKYGNSTAMPSFTFNYWADEDPVYNPPYDPNLYDRWGNISANSKTRGNNGVDYYHHYCELSENIADNNAKTYHLKSVMLPSGGKLEVDYKAKSYGYVDREKPYVMRQISSISKNGITRTNLTVDVSDIGHDGLQEAVSVSDVLFGEVAFYKITGGDINSPDYMDESQIFMATAEFKIFDFGDVTFDPASGKYWQNIIVERIDDDEFVDELFVDTPPLIKECEHYMYNESMQMRLLKEASCGQYNVLNAQYESMEQDGVVDAVRKVIANFKKVFKSDANYETNFNNCFGDPATEIFEGLSFLRTPINKGKYTGARVNTLKYSDQFAYGTEPSGGVDDITFTGENEYSTIYYFDESTNGSGRSSGVATIEPGGGKACIIDLNDFVGTGYIPSPSIISSRTTLKTNYQDDDPSDGFISRDKGKTVYEFFTSKENGYNSFNSHYSNYKYDRSIKHLTNKVFSGPPSSPQGHFYMFGMWTFLLIKFKVFGKKIKIKIPYWLPLTLKWNRRDNYHMKSYAYTDYTDIYGRPKSIVQYNASGDVEAEQQFTYFDKDEEIPIYNEGWANYSLDSRPGVMSQAWSEAYYTKDNDITLIPWILTLKAKTNRDFCYTNMKYSYVPPILKEVKTVADGQVVVTKNKGFDYYTGTPIEVRSNDSYQNTKIKRTEPAYWRYPNMGPQTASNPDNMNKLTSKTGSYMYLNSIGNANVLGASVTTWAYQSEEKWRFIPYLQPSREDQGSSTMKYVYEYMDGNTINNAYSTATGSNTHIKRNPYLYKPYESYTYDVDLKNDNSGTFLTYTNFNYSTPSGNWKLINRNELFDAKGVMIQVSDAIGKYASQHMGYNYSNAISVVANSTWAASVFEGAENLYTNSLGEDILECGKVELLDAKIISADCEPEFESISFEIEVTNLPGPQDFVKIEKPQILVYNQPFARLDIEFNNGINRTYLISIDENENYRVVSNMGETFNGYIVFKLNNDEDWLLFDFDNISTFNLNSSFPSGTYQVSILNTDIPSCDDISKTYLLPLNNCFGEVHTGNYAFWLESGKSGTQFQVKPSVYLDNTEYDRKYKALVWVHKLSPLGTELVIKKYTSPPYNYNFETITVSLQDAYTEAGNWKLLRADFDLYFNYYTAAYIKVYIKNNSESGIAIYDDLRVLPYGSEMSNFVYDHQFNRVTSTLDADHFATYSTYDDRGRMSESAIEIQNIGKQVVKRFLYNDQKQN